MKAWWTCVLGLGGVALAAPAGTPIQMRLQGSTASPTTLNVGVQATFQVRGADPGDRVWLIGSDGVVGPGPCFPFLAGPCMPMTRGTGYRVLGSALAGASGVATFSTLVDANTPLRDWVFAAYHHNGRAGSVSDAIVVTTLGACPVDDVEGGPWWGAAAPFPDAMALNGLTVCEGAGDFFEVQVAADEVFVAQAEIYTPAAGTHLDVVVPGGTVSAIGGSSTQQYAVQWRNDTGAEATVRVGVTTPVPALTYDLRWFSRRWFVPHDDCAVDAGEPNSLPAMATPVDDGLYEDLFLCGTCGATEEDWYVVDGYPLGMLGFDLLFDQADGNLEMEIYDAQGVMLIDSVGDHPTEYAFIVPVDDGPVYLRVWQVGDSGGGQLPHGMRYDLDVTNLEFSP